MNYTVKYEILTKISAVIRLYAKVKNLYRYLKFQEWKDKDGFNYKVILLDDVKLFEHSEFFKSHKNRLKDKRGDITDEYYEKLETWLMSEYGDYYRCEMYIKDIIISGNIEPSDLLYLNKLYKDLKKAL